MKMTNEEGQIKLAKERLVKAVNQVLGIVRRNKRSRKVGLALVLMVLLGGRASVRNAAETFGLDYANLLEALGEPPAGLRSPTRTSQQHSSRWTSHLAGHQDECQPDLPAPPVPPDHAQNLVDRLDQPLLSQFDFSLPVCHLFSGTTSKIKNFSLIPTSWYYLPKIPITAGTDQKRAIDVTPYQRRGPLFVIN